MMIKNILKQAVALGELRLFDLQIALFLERFSPPCEPEQLLAAALISQAVGKGHICLPLKEIADKNIFIPELQLRSPNLDKWVQSLDRWPAVGRPGDTTPLILDHANRIYLKKYYSFQKTICTDLLKRARDKNLIEIEKGATQIHKLFPDSTTPDWQKVSAALALLRQLVVITGGPGTGKTYTVARILALLQILSSKKLLIGIGAPTGKAANRLGESIAAAKKSLDPVLQECIPEEAKTIHRLLGVATGSQQFLHNKDNRLNLDLLVLDESSMIDIPLMSALLSALPSHTQLIMLGDRDQLSSVEAGSLLGDICAAPLLNQWSPSLCGKLKALTGFSLQTADIAPFADSLVQLKTSHRFSKTGNIGRLADIINQGDENELNNVISADRQEDFRLIDHSSLEKNSLIERFVLPELIRCLEKDDKEIALNYFNKFRVLCALRNGPFGVTGINAIIETSLKKMGLIANRTGWYKGQPVMIHNNHYGLQLFNGDLGIIWPDASGILLTWFQRPNGEIQPIAPARLPQHETAYAITIHKSQGSEFDEVVIILPSEDVRILSRELLYTGITRARKKLTLYSPKSILFSTLKKRVNRYSGIKDYLYNQPVLQY